MAKAVRYVPDRAGFAAILKGPEVSRMVGDSAARIAARAGEGVDSKVWHGDSREVGIVQTVTRQAAARNSRNNTLLRAMEAGRVR